MEFGKDALGRDLAVFNPHEDEDEDVEFEDTTDWNSGPSGCDAGGHFCNLCCCLPCNESDCPTCSPGGAENEPQA